MMWALWALWGWLVWLSRVPYFVIDVLLARLWISYASPLDLSSTKNKTVVITGATSGIGKSTATALAKAGANVILAVRNTKAGEDLIKSWREEGEVQAEVMELDLNSLASVEAFAAKIKQRKMVVDVLVNNAGVFTMYTSQKSRTADGFEQHIGVNFLAHFKLTALLLPAIRRSKDPKIINLSSAMHRVGWIHLDDLSLDETFFLPVKAYSQSKIALILFTTELQQRLNQNGDNIKCFSVDPGIVHTGIARDIHPVLAQVYNLSAAIQLRGLEGALTTLVAMTDRQLSVSEGGQYLAYGRVAPVTWPLNKDKLSKALWVKACECVNLDAAWAGGKKSQ